MGQRCLGMTQHGASRSHLDLFKAIRGARVDHFVVETNKLLIRLDKLLSPDAPTDPKRRKEKLVNPAFQFEGVGFLKRTNSNTSINSLVSVEGEQHMRVCKICRQLLERRDNMTEMRNTKPPIVQLYEKLKMCIEEAENVLPQYLPMVESLSQGESRYTYREAMILRTKLVKLYEAIDQLSKRIVQFGLNQDPPPNPKQIYLQKAIRIYASNFMQENLMGLQNMPTEEEVNQMQEKRKTEIQRKIAAERQAAMEAQERERVQREKELGAPLGALDSYPRMDHLASKALGHRRQESGGSVGRGWKPEGDSGQATRIADPMLQQIEIIRGYIRQAKQARKLDEVAMLEQNLRDLQLEYVRQSQSHNASS
nr:hypothetical protein BaRGS_002026 [Batillaria attramentaria]